MASKNFEEMLAKIPPETTQYVEKNIAIGFQVRHILESHPTIHSQKDLAEALGKEPSEISKWLSGLHNIGLENITKMETVLGQDIILTVEEAKERYAKPVTEEYQPFQTAEHIETPGQSNSIAEFRRKKAILLAALPAVKHPIRKEEKEAGEFAY
jgi:transcriptional regulator with XRE-family HTH domain